MVNKIARWLLRSVFVVLWLVVLALAVELYSRFAWRAMERSNPYLVAVNTGQPWPDPQTDELTPAADTDRVTEPAPSDTFDACDTRRYACRLFDELNKEERLSFARAYQEVLLVTDANGSTIDCYGDDPIEPLAAVHRPDRPAPSVRSLCADAALEECLGAIREVLESGQAVQREVVWGTTNGTLAYPSAFFPIAEPAGVGIALPAATSQTPLPPKSLWRIPFFIYRNHAAQPRDSATSGGFRTNNFGFRAHDVSVPKPPGVFRIACVGGSTTEEGNSDTSTYPCVLGKKLNAALGTSTVETINCGISGIASLRERYRFQDYLCLQPDLVVYYDGVNDICHLHLQGYAFHASRWQERLRRSWFINRHFNAWFFPSDAVIAADLEATTFRNIRSMVRMAREKQVEVAICSFARPHLETLTATERDYYEYNTRNSWGGKYVSFATYCRVLDLFNRKLKQLCEEEKLLYIPVAESIQGGGKYFGDICHMKDNGIVLKAEIIARYLAERLKSKLTR